ncbi:fibronectin type III domain-containing protein [Winogradskyella sp. 3972H.M.0a.05]|uniref:fibronectin type III domain-containing protein n=1 Tax=Winogradskyella sp. 3972H.M.0a.05 TaxID=2950277 RepID=UPI00339AD6D4
MKKIITLFTVILILNSCSNSDSNADNGNMNCNTPSSISICSTTTSSTNISWISNSENTSYEIELGVAGFNQGNGTIIITVSNNTVLMNLAANTSYDFYIRTDCGVNSFSNWVGPYNFTTQEEIVEDCPFPIDLNAYNIDDNSAVLGWYINDSTNENAIVSFDIEYGVTGFTLGTGNTITTSEFNYHLNNLSPSTQYDFYIKSNCTVNSSDFIGPSTFTTQASCIAPTSLYNFSTESCSIGIEWSNNNETAWEVEYGEVGFTLGTGTVINTSDTNFILTENIAPSSTYEVYVRANCGSEGYSEYTEALVVTSDQIDQSYIGDWTIEMTDLYGDGWSGNLITVTVNDVVTNATLQSGS